MFHFNVHSPYFVKVFYNTYNIDDDTPSIIKHLKLIISNRFIFNRKTYKNALFIFFSGAISLLENIIK